LLQPARRLFESFLAHVVLPIGNHQQNFSYLARRGLFFKWTAEATIAS
jgi:hypothetical protein